jgi:glycosyltransferase involved in cell wall biosynthesis
MLMNLCPHIAGFESASIILPVINETTSLQRSVETILHDVKPEDLKELIIVVCHRTTAESRAVIRKIQRDLGPRVVVLEQKRLFLGGALRDGFDVARGSHIIIMGSDLETNPADVRHLITEARKNPTSVVSTSRWIHGGEFHGYSGIKLVCNWFFQRGFSLLYLTKLTDLTFGFRILPTALVRSIHWEEIRHPFNLECILKPLRLGVHVTEIPTIWRCRTEGESQNSFFRNFEYFRIGLKLRFVQKKSFLLPTPSNEKSHRYHHNQSSHQSDSSIPGDDRLGIGGGGRPKNATELSSRPRHLSHARGAGKI